MSKHMEIISNSFGVTQIIFSTTYEIFLTFKIMESTCRTNIVDILFGVIQMDSTLKKLPYTDTYG